MRKIKVKKHITDGKQLATGIKRAKKDLIEYAKKHGVYENFGNEHYMALKDRYIDAGDYSEYMKIKRSELERFGEWCMNYTGK